MLGENSPQGGEGRYSFGVFVERPQRVDLIGHEPVEGPPDQRVEREGELMDEQFEAAHVKPSESDREKVFAVAHLVFEVDEATGQVVERVVVEANHRPFVDCFTADVVRIPNSLPRLQPWQQRSERAAELFTAAWRPRRRLSD